MNAFIIKTTVKESAGEKTGYAGYDVEDDEFSYLTEISSPNLCAFKSEKTAEDVAILIKKAIEDCSEFNHTESYTVEVVKFDSFAEHTASSRKLMRNAAIYYYLSCC